MVKSYPGFAPIFLILFFVIVGTWMFINPLLNDNPADYELNYGGLIFTAIGFSLTLNLKKISFRKEGIQVKQLVTRKETATGVSEISQITLEEDHRHFLEIYFSILRSRRGRTRITIRFTDKLKRDVILIPYNNTSFYLVRNFLRDNYSELINEQEIE